MAGGMGDHKQREYNKIILPESSGETTYKNKLNRKLYNLSHRPREHKIIPPQIQSY
jgi:hypothetical protein